MARVSEESLLAEAQEQLRLGRKVAEAALAIQGDTELRLQAVALAARAMAEGRKAFREVGYAIFAAGGEEGDGLEAGAALH